MNYRLLNEVLIEWNESFKEDSNNVFLKSKDIERSFDKCLIYKPYRKDQIKIFDTDWPEFEKYKDKVWINDKHIKLDNNIKGWTEDIFAPGEYKVYIKNIDKVTDMTYMFYDCQQLVSAFIPNSITSIGKYAFYNCTGLTSVTIPNSVVAIGGFAFEYCSGLTSMIIGNSLASTDWSAFYDCRNLKTVYVEDINKFNQIKFKDETADPRCYGAKVIELKK